MKTIEKQLDKTLDIYQLDKTLDIYAPPRGGLPLKTNNPKNMKTIEKQYITWHSIEDFIKSAFNYLTTTDIPFTKIQQLNKTLDIYAPPRGGLPFVVMLSHYAEHKKWKVNILDKPKCGCIILDDISDTGNTIKTLLETNNINREDITVVTMFYHKQSVIIPNYYAFIKDTQWIVYPYELGML